ncbi:MAG TPA: hypothetical protein PL072_07900 [Phycisphaerales bacterium]|nr:hypothetical protein [Phycisphaerales bacterium]
MITARSAGLAVRSRRSPAAFAFRSVRTLLCVSGLAASVAAVSLGLPGVAAAQSDGNASASAKVGSDQLPVKKITLYRSGVGYFERAGTIDGNGEVQLRFNTDQINDILKSMVLLDLDGGRVESVSYGSKEPLAKRLASFGINIADNPSAGEILQRLRGTPVKLTTAEGDLTGTIMNVETRPTVIPAAPGAPATVHNLPWINLVTNNGVRSFNLANVTGFEILDKALAEELSKALGALAEYRADRTKTVDLRFAGAGARRVIVGYVHEMPVWKTSYRMVLPDKDSKSDEFMLQGWAIVENTTDQDWNNVRLGLVSGRPVSFQMDLYEPLFMARPWVSVPTIAGVLPRAYGLGVDRDEDAAGVSGQSALTVGEQSQMEARRNAGRIAMRGAVPAAPAAAPMAKSVAADAAEQSDRLYLGASGDDFANYAQQAQATAAEVGEVFQYQVDQPVSIERQRSAMIPIITTNIPGRRVSIFNSADGSEYPRRGVEIKNTGNLQLLPGPISVIDGSAYAGDAQVGQIPKGDKRLLSYALDLNVTAINKSERNDTIISLKINDGLLLITSKLVNTTTYEFANKDSARDRTLIVEHSKWDGWKLVEPAKPSEETKDLYRFEMDIASGKTGKLEVRQEMVQTQRAQVLDGGYPLQTIVELNRSGKVSDKVLEAVRTAASKQNAINQTQRDIAQIDARVGEITAEQARIRENMRTIDRTTQLYTKYMTKLSEQETTLESLAQSKDAAQKKLEQQRQELADYLRGLNVE